MRVEDSFFYVAMTTPFLALMPREVYPLATAAKAFYIWGSFPEITTVFTLCSECGEWEVAHGFGF